MHTLCLASLTVMMKMTKAQVSMMNIWHIFRQSMPPLQSPYLHSGRSMSIYIQLGSLWQWITYRFKPRPSHFMLKKQWLSFMDSWETLIADMRDDKDNETSVLQDILGAQGSELDQILERLGKE
ncbi:hypothetical protein BS47DRAFT_895652 [Hydnum rufescens UP504]|uniref:Uncharacterized protein n=1 Tax=Hydnum rufescens UP504 TaxID=1448309 RepID=A0A9P6DXQ3_9AGAM|nr:hypothetical protein BS47DRAFT_895652 [Hydnum rufescens UP504]